MKKCHSSKTQYCKLFSNYRKEKENKKPKKRGKQKIDRGFSIVAFSGFIGFQFDVQPCDKENIKDVAKS